MDARVDLVEATLCDVHAAMDERLARGRTFRLRGLEVRVSGLPAAPLNMAALARVSEEDAETVIDESLRIFREAGVPFSWWVGPRSTPADLPRRLLRRGLGVGAETTAMVRSLDRVPDIAPQPGLAFHRVPDAARLEDFLTAFGGAFGVPEEGMPAWSAAFRAAASRPDGRLRLFVGLLKGEPVASGVVFAGRAAAALHSIGTLPRLQGRGIGAAMTARLLREARDADARTAVLESTPDGRRLYARLGFEEAGALVAYGP